MTKPHQHFIPKTYLRKFAHTQNGPTYLVDTFNKLSGKIIPNLSVNDICVETDLYTLKNLQGDDKYKIENFFSENIETKYPEIFKLLVQEKKQIISAKERMFILYTTLSMYFRTPKVLNQFVSFSAKLIEEALKNTGTDTIDFLGYKINIKEKSFASIKKEIKETHRINYVKTQLNLLDEFVKFKSLDGIVVIELFGDQEFITSDNPVEIRNSSELNFNLFDLSNSIYIPLDPKHALFIAPKQENATINQVFYQRDNFFQHIILNHCLFKNAERWIIGTKEGISNFIRDEEQYGKPVEDDHPIVVKAKTKLELMQSVLAFAEKGISNQNIELINCLKNLKQHEFYETSIEFQDLYQQMKELGLRLP